MTIIECIYACVLTGFILLMIALLIDLQRERDWREKERRLKIKHVFEHKMHALRMNSNIDWKDRS